MWCLLTPSSDALVAFDLDAAWRLSPRVSLRPERFGALLYDFGTRRLSFLKDPGLARLVTSLADAPSARAALAECGNRRAAFERALHRLAETGMISRRDVP